MSKHNPGYIDRIVRNTVLGTAITIITIASGTAAAMPPEVIGEQVSNIEKAGEISGWSHIDNQRILVNLSPQNTYLLTLKHQCHGLQWARDVTVSMSNGTIWAGFDAIKADGLQCPIDGIWKVSPAEMLKLGH